MARLRLPSTTLSPCRKRGLGILTSRYRSIRVSRLYAARIRSRLVGHICSVRTGTSPPKFRSVVRTPLADDTAVLRLPTLCWDIPQQPRIRSPSSLVTKGVGSRYELYMQDTWKLTQKLTATLGLRYDLQWLRPDAQNYGSLFIPNLGKVAVFADSMPPAAIPGALNAYPVVLSKSLNLPVNVTEYIGQDTNNFAPRVGLAYKLNNKTVLRSAIGLYYNVLPVSVPISINNLPFVVVGAYEQPAGCCAGVHDEQSVSRRR